MNEKDNLNDQDKARESQDGNSISRETDTNSAGRDESDLKGVAGTANPELENSKAENSGPEKAAEGSRTLAQDESNSAADADRTEVVGAEDDREPKEQERTDDGTAAAGNAQALPNSADSGDDAQNPDDPAEASDDDAMHSSLVSKDEHTGEITEDQGEGGQKNPRRFKRFIRTLIYTTAVLLAAVLITIAALSGVRDMYGISKPDKTIDVSIPSGASTWQVASILRSRGVIENKIAFVIYLDVRNHKKFYKGLYTLSSSMSYQDIVDKLKVQQAGREVVKVTIPEGYTLQQIGKRLQKYGVCTEQDFLNAADDDKITFAYSSQISSNQRFYRLEGYLFPDTYEFYKKQSAQGVVEKMLKNFDDKFNSTLRDRAQSNGMTVDQAATLASIIQAEAGTKANMADISSVFHNRLNQGINGKKLLQSDATIFYIKRDIQMVLSQNDTQINSPYNTYRNEGLPPGPICNPGLDALKAALYPSDTGNYYFVSDSNGNYYFAATYQQHVANVKKAMKTGKAGGTNVIK